MNATTVIVTRNRCNSLQQTLLALSNQRLPQRFQAEIIIVDNGSTDNTPGVVPLTLAPFSQVRLLHQPSLGQAAGRNLALRHAVGSIIAFLDDDVIPPPNWLASICQPIAAGETDAAAGKVALAKELQRPWMTPLHRAWLAETDWLADPNVIGMVGANMAFHRDVLSRVPGFCEALGPGALGFGDDQLFAWQLAAAGFRISKPNAPTVIHQPDPKRLLRKSWLESASKHGKSQAWIGRHWFGWKSRLSPLRLPYARMKLASWRKTYPFPETGEGAPTTELILLQQVACLESLSSRCSCNTTTPSHAPT